MCAWVPPFSARATTARFFLRNGMVPRMSGGGTPFPNEGPYSWKASMKDLTIPAARPVNPRFSSGPCAKIPHYTLDLLADAPLGRSHRAAIGKAKLAEAIDLTREVLGVPADYRIGIVPASGSSNVKQSKILILAAALAQFNQDPLQAARAVKQRAE